MSENRVNREKVNPVPIGKDQEQIGFHVWQVTDENGPPCFVLQAGGCRVGGGAGARARQVKLTHYQVDGSAGITWFLGRLVR